MKTLETTALFCEAFLKQQEVIIRLSKEIETLSAQLEELNEMYEQEEASNRIRGANQTNYIVAEEEDSENSASDCAYKIMKEISEVFKKKGKFNGLKYSSTENGKQLFVTMSFSLE
jgi:hypothetical protein